MKWQPGSNAIAPSGRRWGILLGAVVVIVAPVIASCTSPAVGVPRALASSSLGAPVERQHTTRAGSKWARIVLRSLTQKLWELGAPSTPRTSDRHRSYPSEGSSFEYVAFGPGKTGWFKSQYPGGRLIRAAFSEYCRPRRRPSREKMPDGETRLRLRGLEPRSGARCEILVRRAKAGGWRFRIDLRRP